MAQCVTALSHGTARCSYRARPAAGTLSPSGEQPSGRLLILPLSSFRRFIQAVFLCLTEHLCNSTFGAAVFSTIQPPTVAWLSRKTMALLLEHLPKTTREVHQSSCENHPHSPPAVRATVDIVDRSFALWCKRVKPAFEHCDPPSRYARRHPFVHLRGLPRGRARTEPRRLRPAGDEASPL